MRNPFWNTADIKDYPDAGTDLGKTKVLPVIPITIPAKKKKAGNTTGLVLLGVAALLALTTKKKNKTPALTPGIC